jgi:hypothetical protein
MENAGEARITIDQLAAMVARGFVEMGKRVDDLRAEMLDGFGTLERRVVSIERGLKGVDYRVGQLETKLDEHRQETRDGFADIHRLVGGISHALEDHEERLKELNRG